MRLPAPGLIGEIPDIAEACLHLNQARFISSMANVDCSKPLAGTTSTGTADPFFLFANFADYLSRPDAVKRRLGDREQWESECPLRIRPRSGYFFL